MFRSLGFALVTAQAQENKGRGIEVPDKVISDRRDDFLNTVVIPCRKRQADARIAAEEENHADLDISRVLSREVAHLRDLARHHQGADEEGAVSRDDRNRGPLENAKEVKSVCNEHHAKRDAQHPRCGIVRIAFTRVTENEQSLHHHKEADAEQSVIAAVVQKVRIVVQNLEAEISTERHREPRLQKIAIANAQAVLADKEHDDGHDGSHRELRDILVVAAFDKALLDGAALVEHKPVPHEEGYHEETDND